MVVELSFGDIAGVTDVASWAAACVDGVFWVTGEGGFGVLVPVGVLSIGVGVFSGSSPSPSNLLPLVTGFFIGIFICGVFGGVGDTGSITAEEVQRVLGLN